MATTPNLTTYLTLPLPAPSGRHLDRNPVCEHVGHNGDPTMYNSTRYHKEQTEDAPVPSIAYAKLVSTPNSNFSLGSHPNTLSSVRPSSSFWSTWIRKKSFLGVKIHVVVVPDT
ncbi:hypothetical protein CVT25_015177 [Psilocybe cyanescens]|uniref:Uncharacterized protein n=1 Tax=Psilocybe cyanescens TaxID=93625 RepID=A0A409XAE3_PSICY|nr:hypothetical protein CVT25_015177 [Psilocybe cyanescens]